MRDLARLGVDRGIVVLRLELCEHLERRARQLGPEQQGLETRDDGVAAEDAHEPRDARARELADARVVRAHPQRGEIGDRLATAILDGQLAEGDEATVAADADHIVIR